MLVLILATAQAPGIMIIAQAHQAALAIVLKMLSLVVFVLIVQRLPLIMVQMAIILFAHA